MSTEYIKMVYKLVIINLVSSVLFVTCRELESKNTTNELSFKSSIVNGIQNRIWDELIDPVPLIVSVITYTVLKFTGVLGFLRLLYTIINQSNA